MHIGETVKVKNIKVRTAGVVLGLAFSCYLYKNGIDKNISKYYRDTLRKGE